MDPTCLGSSTRWSYTISDFGTFLGYNAPNRAWCSKRRVNKTLQNINLIYRTRWLINFRYDAARFCPGSQVQTSEIYMGGLLRISSGLTSLSQNFISKFSRVKRGVNYIWSFYVIMSLYNSIWIQEREKVPFMHREETSKRFLKN